MKILDMVADLADSIQRRGQEREMERELAARRGKLQVQRHIDRQREMARKLWELGKRALEVGEPAQFQQIGKQYLWTQADIKRWQSALLTLEVVEARRDQAKSFTEFTQALRSMSASILTAANPAELAKTQRDLELAVTGAQRLEESMDYVMDAAGRTVFAAEGQSNADQEAALREMQRSMQQEAAAGTAQAAAAAPDDRIADGLKRIEEEMRKTMK
jgi:hypothetical protein